MLARVGLISVGVALLLVVSSCGDEANETAGPTAPTRTTTSQSAALTPAEQRWFEQLQRFTTDVLQSLVALSSVSGGWDPQNIHLDFDPRVFDSDSDERGVLVTQALPALLDCKDELRRTVRAAPSKRMAAVRAHVADACSELGLGASFITLEVLQAQDDRDLSAKSLGAAEEGLASGLSALRKADAAAQMAGAR